ncbi:Endopolyphosphatase, variant 2 [Naganishia albida]|nr:Endopolyphosphatase, variant 2 [Naganishia albida]
MKLSVIATLIVAHRAVAYSSHESLDDSLAQPGRHGFLHQSSNSLESLMSRSNDKGRPKAYTQVNDGMQPPEERVLKGRFIHITDFHPDPHYIAGGDFDSGCHRKPEKNVAAQSLAMSGSLDSGVWQGNATFKRKDDDRDVAGRWGSAASDCDTPMSLVDLTFAWLQKEWANEVDFVVWTGDNARHDIDREIPRTPKEIYELNRMMAGKMRETFGENVIVVPSIGNNDIWPHNILQPGPNAVTNEFSNIWSDFIPAEEYHVFQRGAYFSSEVIPDKLAVISLNTIYWYDSNKAVDGCKDGSDEPGALEFDWLEVQLDSFRERGMQVWLTGHVPPHMGLYFDNCYLRYGELALRFQDTIVGHLYGHQNVDHFFFIDVDELEHTQGFAPQAEKVSLFSQRMSTFGRNGDTALQQDLFKDFDDMPKVSKMKLEDYTVVNVSPSVIPTYLPGVRVYSYNVTGLKLDDGFFAEQMQGHVEQEGFQRSGMETEKRRTGHRHRKNKKKKKKKDDCSKPEHEDQPHCKFRQKERHFSPESPSRSNTLFTPLGYAQFYLPDIDEQTKSAPEWFIEYTTYTQDGLLRGGQNGTDGDVQGRQPVPWHLLPGYREFIEHRAESTEDAANDTGLRGEAQGEQKGDKGGEDPYTRFKAGLKKITPYHLEDLTIPSYAHFAKKLTRDKQLWKRFSSAMYLTTKDEK